MSRAPIVLVHSDAPEPVRAIVAAAHPDLAIHTCETYAGLPAALAATRAEVVYSVRFDGTPRFPCQALIDSPTVTWVAVGGSGTDHLGPWDPARLTVTNAAGVAADTMAEYAIGTALSFTLGLRDFAKAQAGRRWVAGRVAPITGRTMLILGLGHTGRAVARRAKALGLTVLGARAHPAPMPDIDEVHGTSDLPDLWPRADVVVVCVPLLPATRGLVGRDAFAGIKAGAVLVDVSRGGVVDEAALLDALRSGQLAGAALDVFTTEPLPADHPFWSMGNVIVTPHCSSVFEGWERTSAALFADNLACYRRGEARFNVVDPVRGY